MPHKLKLITNGFGGRQIWNPFFYGAWPYSQSSWEKCKLCGASCIFKGLLVFNATTFWTIWPDRPFNATLPTANTVKSTCDQRFTIFGKIFNEFVLLTIKNDVQKQVMEFWYAAALFPAFDLYLLTQRKLLFFLFGVLQGDLWCGGWEGGKGSTGVIF